uniref:Uncharacterized protein n=1 Tax=Megaselia scalaris TaxID=36166 RepID=T1GRL8_MEGSC
SYELKNLCSEVLKEENCLEINNNTLVDRFGNSDGIIQLIQISMMHTLYILRIMYELNIMPLAIQISNICGFFIGKTLQGGRSERNEYLLLHAFNEKNYIVPDKRKHKRGIEREEFAMDMTTATQGDLTQVEGETTTVGANGKRKKAAYA